jgi:hypothetical protein
MGLGDRVLVRTQNNLGFLVVHVQTTEEQDETRKGCVTGNGFEPVVC